MNFKVRTLENLIIIVIKTKCFIFKNPLFILKKQCKKIRHTVLPTFWWIGLHDCDSGGMIFASYTTWAWGNRSIDNVYKNGNGSSDGPATIREINLNQFIKCKQQIKE